MEDTPTLAWDFSGYLSYGDCGVVIEVNLDVFPGEDYMVTNFIDEQYGTAQSPLDDSGSVVLDALPNYISYCEMDVYIHVYFRYSGSPWNWTTTQHAEYWLYTVLDAPVAPQEVPFAGLLGLATKWMRFTDNADDALRQLVKRSWGVKYDGETPYIDDSYAIWEYDPGVWEYQDDWAWSIREPGYTQRFRLTQWLTD